MKKRKGRKEGCKSRKKEKARDRSQGTCFIADLICYIAGPSPVIINPHTVTVPYCTALYSLCVWIVDYRVGSSIIADQISNKTHALIWVCTWELPLSLHYHHYHHNHHCHHHLGVASNTKQTYSNCPLRNCSAWCSSIGSSYSRI